MVKQLITRLTQPSQQPQVYEWLNVPLPAADMLRPTLLAAKYAAVIAVKRSAAKSTRHLVIPGWLLLVLVLVVSFLHTWAVVSRIAPPTIKQPQLPDEVYWIVAGAQTVAIDLTAIYLVAVNRALELCRLSGSRKSLAYILALVFGLNVAYVAKYAGQVLPAMLLPVLDEVFVIALPLFIVVAYVSVKNAMSLLTAAQLKLQVEIATLEGAQQQLKPAQTSKIICSCGAEFDSPKALDGHQAHCPRRNGHSVEKVS